MWRADCRAYAPYSGSHALARHSVRFNVASGCFGSRLTLLCPFLGAGTFRTVPAVYDVLSVAHLRDDCAQRMDIGRPALGGLRSAEHSRDRHWIEGVAVNGVDFGDFDRSSLPLRLVSAYHGSVRPTSLGLLPVHDGAPRVVCNRFCRRRT